MDLPTIWFVLIAVLFTGYFFLEGFDFGVGILLPFVGRDNLDRRVAINTIGPFWDANEVWLLTAGGAMFAAFPHWYATLFSTYYVPLFFVLLALIVRAVGFEFRGKVDDPRWRAVADQCIFWGSLLPAFLWGVAITGIVRGLPIGAELEFAGSILDLVHPFALAGGVVSVLVFALHGALFLALRSDGEVRLRAERAARRLWLPAAAVLLAFFVASYSQTNLFDDMGLVPGSLPLLAMIAFAASGVFVRSKRTGWAFATTGATIVFATVVAFEGLFPRVMPSSLDPAYHLTIYNASSSQLTLTVMLVVALVLVPIVLLYQGYSYWVFRKRVSRADIAH